jgi:PAS domain S-box-containing protein
MLTKFFRWLPLPRSLRWQFTLALSVPALLIVAGGLTAVYGWRISSDTARRLAEQDLEHLQHAQDLAQSALLIENESHRMLTVDSIDTMQASYREILERLDHIDALVLHLDQASDNLEVLALNQANQLFRNTVHIVAHLRKNLLADRFVPPESTRRQETLLHFDSEMHRQVSSLVDSTYDLSARFTRDYQETLRQLTATADQDQARVLALLIGSVFMAGLVSRYFLGHRVVGRLQQVSNCLRLEETSQECLKVPVQGNDEIGDMACAVEHFLEDRRLLVETQHDLRRNKEMLQAIIEMAPVAIIGLDRKGNVNSVWNRVAERMLGWSAREVMGRPFPAVPVDKKEEFRGFGKQIRNGEILNGIEVSRIKRDGTPIDYSIYGSALHDSEDRINGYIGVLVDISERKRTERALKLTQFSVDRTLDAVYWVNPEGQFIYVNDSACKALDYSRSELLTMSVPDIAPEFPMEIWPSHWEELKEKRSFVFETTNQRKDGTVFPVEIAVNYIQFEDKEYNCAFARDITRRKLLDDQLRRKNEDLECSNAELEQFAYVASHDLQEPLRKVASYMELVTERYREKLDRDGIQFIDYAVDGARRMKTMIDDLLKYSHLGRRDENFVPVDMMDVMYHVLNDLELAIRDSGAVVSYDALPMVTADNSQLQQLFRNLIGNALKYRGADPPEIHVSAQQRKQAWQFSIKDNGIGIEPRFFERIFKIFQRLHPRGQFNGTGIGLAVCKKIVERHGGTIGVESVPGQGSTFSFTIADHRGPV